MSNPLDPPLPFDMRARVGPMTRDRQLQRFVNTTTHRKDLERRQACREAFGDRYDDLRRLAGRIKQHTLDHLDRYLEEFIDRATDAGARVHYAKDGAEANAIALEIARRRGCRLCVKSKSMVTEETQLLRALEKAGVQTFETDLGEFIIQLDDDAPAHIVTPMIHKDRGSVARAFHRELGAEYTEDPERLTAIARQYLRRLYRHADLGISGGNFLVADTGTLVICTNEGNADLCVSGPPVHIAFVGIEKVVPRLEDLSVLLKLLARSATGQELTVYTTFITGPRRAADHDGPEELHLILVDNGRTRILAEESRELLRCIRCGACLNACPVFRKAGGGHAYGAVYSGPIGAVITPLFKGLASYPDLPRASSLCGACREACPVDIDIPHHLVRLRGELVRAGESPFLERLAYRAWSRLLEHPPLYRFALRLLRSLCRSLASFEGRSDPFRDRAWLRELPAPLATWSDHRDVPTPTRQGFRDWWGERHRRTHR